MWGQRAQEVAKDLMAASSATLAVEGVEVRARLRNLRRGDHDLELEARRLDGLAKSSAQTIIKDQQVTAEFLSNMLLRQVVTCMRVPPGA
jgi:hypothetical protein